MRRSHSILVSLRHRSAVILSIVIFSTLSFAAAPDRIMSAVNTNQNVALNKSVHFKAQPQYDQGPVDGSQKLTYLSLVMSPSASQQKALNLLLAQQQDPKSPNYHQWLTPQQYADRFGLSQNDLTKVTNWLTSQGFEIQSIGGGRNYVAFSGTVSQAERAFRTEIHSYKINDEEHFANATPVLIPSALNGIVTGVMGLHNFLPHPAHRGRGVAAGAGNSHGEYYDSELLFPNFLAPDDVSTIYDIAPLYGATPAIDGTGQKLAVIGQTDVYLADLNDFRSGFGLSTISCTTNGNGIITACNDAHFKYVLNGTETGAVSTCGDLGEADLDIEWSGATARNAQIVYVNSPVTYNANCTAILSGGGVNAALVAAINPPTGPPLAPVISMSYGYCEAGSGDLETYLQQANAESVTVLNSSGDVGATACDYSPPNNNQPFTGAQYGLAVSYPASSPEVTGVGGTGISLANDSYPNPSSYWSTTLGTNGGTAVSYIPELAWNDDVELGQFCQSDPTSSFCKTGGSPAVPGWVALTASATAAQVQEDIWIAIGGGGASNCWYETGQGVCLGAGAGPGGGGFAQPPYQQGLSVPNAPAGVRYVPDVSMLASPDFPGYIFCTAQSELENGGTSTSSCAGGIANALNNGNYISVVGGTSASTPVFAGIVTLLNQYVLAKGIQTTLGLGNINTNLYKIAKNHQNAFHQVKSGSNLVYCQVGTPAGEPSGIMCPAGGVVGYQASDADSATGYNLVTGLGSIDANNLFLAWASSSTPDFTIAVTASPSSTLAGHNLTWNGTATATNGYSSTINLSCGTGAPSTCTITPSSLIPVVATPFTVTVGSSTPGTYSFNIQGTDGTITNTQAVSLTVSQDFSVPGSLTAPAAANPGQSTSTTMLVSPVGSGTFSSNVTFACSAGLPTGATCSFSPQITSGSSATTVTVTVQTAGPFTGAAGSARHHTIGKAERLWIPLSLPFAGMVLVGLAGVGIPRRYKIVGLCLALAFAGALVACGGGSGSSTPPPVSVAVTPATVATLYPSLPGAPAQTMQFAASVSNSTNQSVTWAVSGSGNGTIDSTGLYTAPAALPSPNSAITISATAAADTTKVGTAAVTLKAPTPSGTSTVTVTVTEGLVTHTSTFSLAVN